MDTMWPAHGNSRTRTFGIWNSEAKIFSQWSKVDCKTYKGSRAILDRLRE